MTLQANHGIAVAAATVRRWLHEIGGVWQQAQLVATEEDPQRGQRLAWMRWHAAQWQAHEVLVFADARALPLVPQVGAAWRPQGHQVEGMTPGKHAKHYVAG